MLKIEGKYNTVKVMLQNESQLDEATKKQLQQLADFEPFSGSNIVIMPDTHAGKGATVGTTISDIKAIVPNVIGVDVGCGVFTQPLPESTRNFEKFDQTVRSLVPSGFNINKSFDPDDWPEDLLEEVKALSSKLGLETDRVLAAVGSLGSGNHFIEIDQSQDGKQVLVIHSGSRNFGLQVANWHQGVAVALCDANGVEVSKELAYLTGEKAREYLHDMQVAQRYAALNREVMAKRVVKSFFGASLNDGYQCTHNYISADGTVRKGAISAKAGEQVVIPLNMRDGVIFGRGKGNKAWNESAPHGAGRIMSRGDAKRRLNLDTFRHSMKGIWTSSVNKGTLDEAPMAYKTPETILDVINETVEVEEVYKPVYNFKASEERAKRNDRRKAVLAKLERQELAEDLRESGLDKL